MWNYNHSDELYHYGVLGMKWGVRRAKGSSSKSSSKRKSKTEIHEDYKRAHSKKSVKSMSDKELRDINNRLNMEQQYSKLTEKKKSAGRKFVTGVVLASATAIATKYTSKYMDDGAKWVGQAIGNAIKK